MAQKVESIFKKPHRAAGELTLSERKFEAENTAEKKEVSYEKAVVQSEEVELKRNEMEKSSDKVQEMVWKTKVGRSEWGDYEGAKDAMVAKSMCQARLGTVIVETAAEASLLQREAAPVSRNYFVGT